MKRLFILLIIIITLLSFVTACGDDECTVVFIVEDDIYRVVTVLSGESVFAPEAPCIPGYEFCGWYCGGEPWRGGDPVFGNVTVEAVFSAIAETNPPFGDASDSGSDSSDSFGDDSLLEDVGSSSGKDNFGDDDAGSDDVNEDENDHTSDGDSQDSSDACPSHKSSNWIIDVGASCVSEGKKHMECTVCGEVLLTETLPKGEHRYTVKTVDPMCEAEGEVIRICEICRDSKVIEMIPPTGHKNDSTVTLPTCTEEGFTTNVCKVCGNVSVFDRKEKISHAFGEWYSSPEANCSEGGGMRRDCTVCSYYDYLKVPPLGHEYVFGICARCGVNESLRAEYELNDDLSSYTLVGIDEFFSSDIIIPDYYNGLPITKIGVMAFAERSDINSVTLGRFIEVIEEDAFSACKSLRSITFNEGLKRIEERAFFGCISLLSFEIPNGCAEIGALSFAFCEELCDVYIPESVKIIGKFAFEGCEALISVTFAVFARWTLYEYIDGDAVSFVEPTDGIGSALLLRSCEYGRSDYYWVR